MLKLKTDFRKNNSCDASKINETPPAFSRISFSLNVFSRKTWFLEWIYWSYKFCHIHFCTSASIGSIPHPVFRFCFATQLVYIFFLHFCKPCSQTYNIITHKRSICCDRANNKQINKHSRSAGYNLSQHLKHVQGQCWNPHIYKKPFVCRSTWLPFICKHFSM